MAALFRIPWDLRPPPSLPVARSSPRDGPDITRKAPDVRFRTHLFVAIDPRMRIRISP
jgi:hypothetical protein